MIDAGVNISISLVVFSHTLAAILALALGVIVLAMAKGTRRHRFMGRLWAGLMMIVSLTSFGIGETFGVIHALSIWVIFGMIMAFAGTRLVKGPRGRRLHAAFMIGNYIGLWGAALPAVLTEGRLLHTLIFG